MSLLEKEIDSIELANKLDAQDIFAKFRQEFQIPLKSTFTKANNEKEAEEECIYLCGNSLGLMPKRVRTIINQELDVWGQRGVEGHWNHPYQRPWVTIDEIIKEPLAKIVGAKPVEVTSMSTLTSNIHSMLVAFYQPTPTRYKILIEQKAFPSDHYAVSSHLQSRGIDPEDALLTIGSHEGQDILQTEDIIGYIREHGSSIAVVMLSGIQYYTGQFFEIEKITKAGHEAGCVVGWDLAHAVGNVPLQLHDWNVDFACWCSYKYLNSGAGGIAGLFIHEKYKDDKTRPRFAGWWGNKKENRFEMKQECFEPSEGASGYQQSNPSIFTTVALSASLQVFEEAGGVEALRKKSLLLTGYLERLLREKVPQIKILTPADPAQRGCQLSLEFRDEASMLKVMEGLYAQGIIVDERKPTVIRVAPTPLYNTFEEVYRFVECLQQVIKQIY